MANLSVTSAATAQGVSRRTVGKKDAATAAAAAAAAVETTPKRRKRRRPSPTRTRAISPVSVSIALLLCTAAASIFGISLYSQSHLGSSELRNDGESVNRRLQHQLPEDPALAKFYFGDNNKNRNKNKNKNNRAVHVIQTRFMQQQPHLMELGMARLEIFKTFCLPSMQHQSSGSFMWIIRTDPDLDKSVREGLVAALAGRDNFLLLASNDNPEGLLRQPELDVQESQVWSGSYKLLQYYHEAAKGRAYFESRLDADDALHIDFVKFVYDYTFLEEDSSWVVWCTHSHLEWQYNSPFPTESNSAYGYLVGVTYAGCVTPGLTMAYGKSVTRDHLPPGRHTTLHDRLPLCPADKNSTNCLLRLNGLTPGALRARTPTSAGMNNVVIDKRHHTMYKKAEYQGKIQTSIWDGVEYVFGVNRTLAAQTRQYLSDHISSIAAENLAGQCTKGHSCKDSTKKTLTKLIKVTS